MARQPCLVILASFVVVAALGVGMLRLEVLDNAEKMWVSPGDPLSVQEGFFNDKVGRSFWMGFSGGVCLVIAFAAL